MDDIETPKILKREQTIIGSDNRMTNDLDKSKIFKLGEYSVL